MQGTRDPEVARLWRVSRTIRELCRDRGYEIGDDEVTMSLADFTEKQCPNGIVDRGRLNFFATLAGASKDPIFVFFADEASVGIKTMRNFIAILDQKTIFKGIIIWQTSMTSAARKLITGVSADYAIEDFQEADLLVNITHHQLVPQHEVMTKDEKLELLKRYKLKETQLPRILINDPVAKYYGLKRGQVVKITRPSETAGRVSLFMTKYVKFLLSGLIVPCHICQLSDMRLEAVVAHIHCLDLDDLKGR